MKLGVDAGVLRHQLTGIGWYLLRVLEHLPKSESDQDELLLYSSRQVAHLPRSAMSIDIRIAHSRLPGSVWLQGEGARLAGSDNIDCFWGPAHVLPLSLSRSIRKVLTVHDLVWILHPASMSRYNLFVHKLYFRRSVAAADTIIAVSDQTKSDLVNLLGVDEDKVTVIHEAADDVFRPMSRDETALALSDLGLPPRFVLAVGTIEPRKNYTNLFRAIARMPEVTHLVVAGRRGWKYRSILSEIDRLGIHDRVRLLDYVPIDRLVALYNGASFFIMPSIYEGFGLPLLQAMACGTPVLASRCSSLPEVGGDAAAYFDSTSVDSLCHAMTTLAVDKELRTSMSRKGMVRAKMFSWSRTANSTLLALRGEIRQTGQP